MGLRSWFGRRRARRTTSTTDTADTTGTTETTGTTPKRSLLRNQRDDPRHRRIQEAAAADVATVRQDDRYFDPNSPGNQEPY
jgi:hypothetical protein